MPLTHAPGGRPGKPVRIARDAGAPPAVGPPSAASKPPPASAPPPVNPAPCPSESVASRADTSVHVAPPSLDT